MFRRERTIFEGDTGFEHYQVVDMKYEGRPARVLFTNHHRAAQSGIATDGKPELLFDYNQRLFELAKSLQPKNILIVGGGTYTLPTALIYVLPRTNIDVVEVDSGLDVIARRFFGLIRYKRLNIIHTDGRNYLESTTQKYDLIIIDAFTGTEIPYDLTTIQATIALEQHLKPKGIVAMNIIGTYYGRSMRLRSVQAAYQQTFANVYIHQADDAMSLLVSQNFVIIGQKTSVPYHIQVPPLSLPKVTADNLLLDNPKLALYA